MRQNHYVYLVYSYVQSDDRSECQGHPLGVSHNLQKMVDHFALIVKRRVEGGAELIWDVPRADQVPSWADAREAYLSGPKKNYVEHVVLQCWPPRKLTALQVGNPAGMVHAKKVRAQQ